MDSSVPSTDRIKKTKLPGFIQMYNYSLQTLKGSTRHYKRYSDKIPELKDFYDFLTNFTGGSRSLREAKQISTKHVSALFTISWTTRRRVLPDASNYIEVFHVGK